jgi:hypothetical protein
MYLSKRLVTALFILLSGLMLIPFISLPAQAFSWQLFANAYEEPTLTISNTIGKPGSFFEITGKNYPANATATITINGRTLGTVTTDATGNFKFELSTPITGGQVEGAYFVTVTVNPDATIKFALDNNAPNTWPSPSGGTAQTFSVPAGIAFTNFIYLPIVFR